MKLACLSFTDKGFVLGEGLLRLNGIVHIIDHYANSQVEGGIKAILNSVWNEYEGLVFISATGLAVRLINPFIEDKTQDPAVVVIDDLGRFSISLLSGHIGGANDIAEWIGNEIGAIPVITTASDNRGIDSVDIFAKRNKYMMEDMDSITMLTSMMVNGKRIGIYTEDDSIINYNNLVVVQSLENVDPSIDGLIIVTSAEILPIVTVPFTMLRPKNINIGIGCRKGVETSRIIKAIEEAVGSVNLSTLCIKEMGTIEVKKNETGLIEAAKHFNCQLRIFSIDEIKAVEEIFEKSQFVKDTIGVYSVSEPSAHLLGGSLIARKSKHNGVTISISK